jgi:hypothetical protein
MPAQQFQQALQRLVTDADYREQVQQEPELLLREYPMTPGEVGLLHAVWEATGARPAQADNRLVPLLCDWHACCCCYWDR